MTNAHHTPFFRGQEIIFSSPYEGSHYGIILDDFLPKKFGGTVGIFDDCDYALVFDLRYAVLYKEELCNG